MSMTQPTPGLEQGLTTLLERVKAAKGPDREIDRRLFMFERGFTRIEQDHDSTGPRFYAWSGERYQGEITSQPRPAYTASIEAALAFVERKLPGWRWGVSSHSFRGGETYPDGKPKYVDGYRAHVTERSALRPMSTISDARTPPLAILAALLEALSRANGEQP